MGLKKVNVSYLVEQFASGKRAEISGGGPSQYFKNILPLRYKNAIKHIGVCCLGVISAI